MGREGFWVWDPTWLVSGAWGKVTLPSLAVPVEHFSLKGHRSPRMSPGGTLSRVHPSPNPVPSPQTRTQGKHVAGENTVFCTLLLLWLSQQMQPLPQ